MSVQSTIKRKTAPDIRARKNGEPIVMLTSYHAHTAALVDRYCDVILVGDSLGNVMHGFETTVPVTLEPNQFLELTVPALDLNLLGLLVKTTPITVNQAVSSCSRRRRPRALFPGQSRPAAERLTTALPRVAARSVLANGRTWPRNAYSRT